MFTKENTTLLIQGNCYNEWTSNYIEEYKKDFNNIILSTWDNEEINPSGIQVIKNSPPQIEGPGNVNYQIKSSLEGCKMVTTEYVIKVRTDILIKDPKNWLSFFSTHEKPKRLFVLGLSRFIHFSPRDQIWAGTKEDMLNLFNVPYIEANYPPSINNLYPEIYLGATYCSKFNENIKIFLEKPEEYLLSQNPHTWYGPPKNDLVTKEWEKNGLDYLFPVSKELKYLWYKKFTNGEYNYDESANLFGEFWYDDIKNKII